MVTLDDSQATRAVTLLKAVAHPIRLKIIARLCNQDEHVSHLAAQLDVNQSVISQQLRILRMSRLVVAERRNGFKVYRLDEPRLRHLVGCIVSCCEIPE